ncbi:type VI secretion system-associated FHA domain protein TagH [Enterovibrio paralichthyis]|uniref:type VI secretion system-associated FHA domain protein TagH n=1 Tax=Enterovibrio paralichthyis TaxID=2853805 RepID=UPI001C4729D0|nr:type VI secretion system-associated FHA domain protein TagH [Enterovibrio paralichthyis]MBV7298318.1 type VI secretion system-associated FHA domain protein TagH [Enterovibrio paralichthyis]
MTHQLPAIKSIQALIASCVVVNTQKLEAGLSPSYQFFNNGGSIGSSHSDDWYLYDRSGRVFQHHAEIVDVDGSLCLLDVKGASYMNGATMPVGAGKYARLKDNDVVLIGPYQIRIQLSDVNVKAAQHHYVDNVFGLEQDAPLIGAEAKSDECDFADVAEIDDPLSALDSFSSSSSQSQVENDDILCAPSSEERRAGLFAKAEGWLRGMKTVQADSDFEMSSAIMLRGTQKVGENGMDDKALDRLERDVGMEYSSKDNNDYQEYVYHSDVSGKYGDGDEQNHLVTGPLFRGLGVQTGNPSNMAEMQALSEEMGASLQSAIRGLLDLHRQVEESRFGMMNKNLQPIEDNPLRLGLAYEETVETMFNPDRSVVHLSAPSAVAESLSNVRHHNDAVQTATTEALNQILRAFSPDTLMRRFSAYRRPGQVSPESADAWAWSMYKSYYKELTSERQKGFEKLFWEIFDQAYDRKIRENHSGDLNQ